uniref:Cellulose synthase (UDP-forming) n=1 Tax=Cyanothece sp. (strain PCC 7425 / ATCC 29141) TaxID=395961 RepID=B8HQQ1_CYAP4
MKAFRVNRGKPSPAIATMFRPQTATLVLLGLVALSGLISMAWFSGEGSVQKIFAEINQLQDAPPLWLQVPMVTGEFLLAPTVVLLLVAWGIMQVSPQPQWWSRTLVVGILLILTVRYVLWRSLSTLNLSDPLNGVFSLGLFLLEMLVVTLAVIQLFLILKIRPDQRRQREADHYALAVEAGDYLPNVDILVPTYNEPVEILRRTIIGCQALDYANKKIYLLDDTRRAQVEDLAGELGCEYMARPDNRHAKAGNLNHALSQTQGELIVVFDADFIPTRNFLKRTIGFFQDPQVALVQTPQSFYNPDPIAHNLGLENIITHDEEVFYRHMQEFRDAVGSVVCAGTSFVVRRSALEGVRGFATDSITEDYFTGIRLSAQQHRLVYLDEKLSAGLAAEDIAAFATQRFRWARGTLQAFFIQANPLTIPGLTPVQRLAHLEGLLSWFGTWSRVGFLLMPLAYSFLHVIPVRATTRELMYFLLPYVLVNLTVFSWLNKRSRSALLGEVFSLVLVFPLAITVFQVMLNPFSKGFNVTPKGTQRDRYHFNWALALPLITLFILTALSLWLNLGMCMIKGDWARTVAPEVADSIRGLGLGWIWSGINLLMIWIALMVLMDVPKPNLYNWFDLRRTVRLTYSTETGEQTLWGITTMLSEGGAQIALTQSGFPLLPVNYNLPVTVELMEAGLKLQGQVIRVEDHQGKDDYPQVRIMFEQITLEQHRTLVEMLFCRPGQWKRFEVPGEIPSLILLFKILLRPRVVFDRNPDVRAIAVAKV